MIKLAEYSPQFERFIHRHGKPLPVDLAAYEALVAPNALFVGRVAANLPLVFPANVEEPKVEFGFVEVKDLPNAAVGKVDDINCVIVYHSYILCLLEVFLILLCEPRLLSFVGEAGSEERRPFHRGGNSLGFQHWSDEFSGFKHWSDVLDALSPKCSNRRAMAIYMMHAALRFLWFHEIAHVLDGHVEYWSKDKRLSEVYLHPSTGGLDVELRILEMFADTVAAKLMLSGVFDQHDEYMPDVLQKRDAVDQLLINMVAVIVLGWIWGCRDSIVAADHGNKSSPLAWSSHPSAMSRIMRMLHNLEQWARKRGGTGTDIFNRAFLKLKPELEILSSLDSSMNLLKAVGEYKTADVLFTGGFRPSPELFQVVAERLKRHSYIYRFGVG